MTQPDPNNPGTPPAAPPAAPPDSSDRGYPENTPIAEMTDGQQAAYWRAMSRKHEATAKARGDYDDLKTRAAEADRLRQERETENEKAVREARETAAAEERSRFAPRLVTAEFRAAAAGKLEADRLAELLEDLDLSKYLTDKGEVDEDKVKRKVTAWAPDTAGDGGKTPARRLPQIPGGRREGSKLSGREAGLAEAQKRFGKPAGTPQQ